MQVFLSHSTADKPFVNEFNTVLTAFGVKTFCGEMDIGIGYDIPTKIYEGIENSDFVVYFISKNSIKSKWVQEELSIAKMYEKEKNGVFILPILIDDIDKLPTSIKSKRCAKFIDRKIDIRSKEFKLILKALGISNEKRIDKDLKEIDSKTIQLVIETIVLFSSELQMILSDISFLLRFVTEAKIESIYNRRFHEARNEIIFRNVPEKMQPIMSNLKQIKKIAFSEIIAGDIIIRTKKFLEFYSEIVLYKKSESPKKEWLHKAAESSRSLQRRIAQLEHQLLVFYLKSN